MKKNSADKISREFARRVRVSLKHHLKKIILFGSRARGDFNEGSDYDILVVVDKRRKTYQEIVLDATDEIMNKYDELINYVVYDEAEWEKRKKFPFGLNILTEGKEL